MKKLIGLLLVSLPIVPLHAQDLLGLGTGNYSGISGMTLNPASIVDSRFKFDINLFGFSNYYTNNYVLLKRDAFISGDFFNSKYNSYDAFKTDVLEANKLDAGEKVYARVNNRIQLPLSFMLTTGKKSAIALNISNRTNVMVNNIDQQFAQLAFDRFRNTSLYNREFNMDGANVALLNWVDVGVTYGRVVLDGDKHFLKAAITAKYIGGTASGYFNADELRMSFSDSSIINARTPYANYGHSGSIDEDVFRGRNLGSLKNVASTAGLDIGVVYEFRGRIDRFKYLSPEYETKTRRDKNKYVFRVGASIMDVGRLKFDKGGYNNDFSANISNYNVSGLSIRSAQDLDTALGERVAHNNSVKQYTVALPTAVGFQFDLHVYKGFYVNASTYQPMNLINADQRMEVTANYAVTPRFESRVFGLYVPVTYNKLDNWNVGATLRFGPVYVGSSNLGSLVVNEKTRTADVHAGVRVPIAFGRKTKVAHFFDRVVAGGNTVNNDHTETNNTTIVSNDRDEELMMLRNRLSELENEKQAPKPVVERNLAQPIYITVNNYGAGVTSTVTVDSVQSKTTSTEVEALRRQLFDAQDEIARLKLRPQSDTTNLQNELQQKNNEINYLMRRIAEKELQLKDMEIRMKQLEEEAENAKKKVAPNNSGSTGLNSNRAITPPVVVQAPQSNDRLEQEIAQLRNELKNYELASRSSHNVTEKTVVVPQPVVPVVINDNNRANNVPVVAPVIVYDTVVRYVRDTIKIKADTVYVKADTVNITKTVERIVKQETIQDNTKAGLLQLRLERVLFDVGKSNIKPVHNKGLNFTAKQLKTYPDLKVRISGHTDKTGNPAINQRLSEARANAVRSYLVKSGVNDAQIAIEFFGADEPVDENKTAGGKLMNRRVELAFFQ